MSANGRLTSNELAPVGGGLSLADDTATAWLAMVNAAAKAGVELWVAKPVGAYRSYAVQQGMRTTPQRYGLNPASVVSVAAPGYSTHGDGTSVDVGSFPPAFDLGRFGDAGRKRRAWLIKNAAYYGFTRPFGEADPNHYKHNGTVKKAWLQYRLDWDEMATKAEIEAVVRSVVKAELKAAVGSEITKKMPRRSVESALSDAKDTDTMLGKSLTIEALAIDAHTRLARIEAALTATNPATAAR